MQELVDCFINNNEDEQDFVFIIIYCVKGENDVMDLSQPLFCGICCYVIESQSKLHLHVVANFVFYE